jgi:hypothetical protein
MPEARRITFSMNKAQAIWLESLMSAVRRGADARVLLSRDEASAVAGIVYRAAKRAELMGTRPKQPLNMRCRNGHAYTPENTRIIGDGFRRCWICTRATWKRSTERKRQEAAQKAADLQRHEETCDRILDEKERVAV